MPRPSKTKEQPNNNKVAIYLKDKDTIQYFETDEKGRVEPKKEHVQDTKLLLFLEHQMYLMIEQKLRKGVLVFECEIFENKAMSLVIHPNKNVIVIVHL